MYELNSLDRFDLGTQGDRHEREFWPLLCSRFPSYETLWRRLIVPLTCRIDQRFADIPDQWIRFRSGLPEKYVQTAMAHYSVFYFLGRAAKRLADEKCALEYPEDVIFLLDSVGDNLKRFLGTMNDLGADCGCPVFDKRIAQLPKGFGPFKEISDYRDTLLHDTVLGRGIGCGKTYIPKWNADKSASPLERARRSWAEAEQLSPDDRVSTNDLLERLIREVCGALESLWRKAIAVVTSQPFERKMVCVTKLAEYFPLVQAIPVPHMPAVSGSFSSLGSNTTLVAQPVRSDAVGLEVFERDSFHK